MQAQQYLIHFYKSFGFRQISPAYLDDGIWHIDMIWEQK
jgi:ElaA protein